MSPTKWYYERLEKGVCVKCGINQPIDGIKICKDCQEKCRIQGKISREKNKMKYKENKLKLYHYRKDNNLCVTCGVPLLENSNNVNCESCRTKKSEASRKQRVRYLTSELCPGCGGEREDISTIYCRNCLDKIKDQRDQRRDKGLCTDCGKPFVSYGFLTCESCLERRRELWNDHAGERHNKRKRDLRDKWRNEGLCTRCGKDLEDESFKECKECREKAVQFLELLRANGICTRCKQQKALPGYTSCFECLNKNNRKSREKYEESKGSESYNKKLERDRINTQERRQRRKEAGLCTICGLTKATMLLDSKYPECIECYQHRNERVRKRYGGGNSRIPIHERHNIGLCSWCGINPPKEGKSSLNRPYHLCEDCLSKMNKYLGEIWKRGKKNRE